MKNIIFIFLLLTSSIAYSQDFGIEGREPKSIIWLSGHLETGWNPYASQWDWTSCQGTDDYQFTNNAFYTDFGLTVNVSKYFFIGGGCKSWMLFNTNENDSIIPNFIPFLIDYSFFIGVRLNWVQVGIRHFCSHPINGGSSFSSPMMENNRSYEEIYLRFEF